MNQQTEKITDSASLDYSSSPKSRQIARTGIRIVLWFFAIPVFLILIGAGVLLYVFQGQQINHSFIDTRVQSALQSLFGDGYEISIGSTGLKLVSSSALTLSGADVVIRSVKTNKNIAALSEVEIGLDPWSLVKGPAKFDRLVIKGGAVEGAAFSPAEESSDTTINTRLSNFAKKLVNAEQPFSDGTISSVELSNIVLNSFSAGRIENTPFVLKTAKLVKGDKHLLVLTGTAEVDNAPFKLSANWRHINGGGYQFSMGAGALPSGLWFHRVVQDVPDEQKSGLGLDGTLRVDLRLPFDADLAPQQPYAKIQMGRGLMRLGWTQTAEINHALINARLFPQTNEIVIERSEFSVEKNRFVFFGNLAPLEGSSGFADGVKSDLTITSKLVADDPKEATASQQLIKAQIDYHRKARTLSVPMLQVSGNDEKLSGRLEIKMGKSSPAISGSLKSKKFSVQNLLQAWPLHLSPWVKWWVNKNVMAGSIENLDAEFSIPEGRLNALYLDNGFRKNELSVKADLKAMTVRTVGEVPPLQKAKGVLKIKDNVLLVSVQKGNLKAGKTKHLSVAKGQFLIDQMFVHPTPATLKFQMAGTMESLAAIANLKPLKVADTLAIKPSSLSGNSTADIELALQVGIVQKAEDIPWKVKLVTKDVSSASPLQGRTIKNANVTIDATPKTAHIKGKMNIDGFDAEVDLVEPLNAKNTKLRKRLVKTVVDHKILAQQGIEVDPVMRGKMSVEISGQGNEPERYKIDLTKTDVSLPWISWLKGTGIPATMSFNLSKENGVNTFSNFALKGETFTAAGNLSFDKSGLISASLKNVTLVRGDKFDIDVSKKPGGFNIVASGKSFDGRALIAKAFQGDGFSAEKAQSDVSLQASFGRLTGFNKQVMENAIVGYQTDGGRLTALNIKGVLNGDLTEATAQRKGDTTTFNVKATDAGATLAMANIYEKMSGGKMTANLSKIGNGPYTGPVRIRNFTVTGEERLSAFKAAPAADRRLQRASGKLRKLDLQTVKFQEMSGDINKEKGYFGVNSGVLRNNQIGLTFDGELYNQSNKMNLRGTFMPLFALSRLIGGIPIIGDILSNGKDSGLIGVTYQLKGAASNPQIVVNPVSIVAPGIFKKIFQFQE